MAVIHASDQRADSPPLMLPLWILLIDTQLRWTYAAFLLVAGFHSSIVLTALFLPIGVIVAVRDWRTYQIPNWLIYPALIIFTCCRVFLVPEMWWLPLVDGIAGGGLFLVSRIVTRGKLGLGDVKLSALVAIVLGVIGWIFAVMLACIGALIWVYAAHGRAARETRIPFGAFLSGGAVLAGLALWTLPGFPWIGGL